MSKQKNIDSRELDAMETVHLDKEFPDDPTAPGFRPWKANQYQNNTEKSENNSENTEDFANTGNPDYEETTKGTETLAAIAVRKSRRTMFIVMSAVIVAALLVYLLITKKFYDPNAEISIFPEKSSREESQSTYQVVEQTGVITWLDDETEEITLYSADSQQKLQFSLENQECLYDSYGKPISMNSLSVGRIVEISYRDPDDKTGEKVVESLRLSPQAVEIQNVSELRVDEENQLIYGDFSSRNSYEYDAELLCTYHGASYPIGKVNEQCVVNLTILDKHIYSVTVLQASGYVQLTGTEEYEDCSIVFLVKNGPRVETPVAGLGSSQPDASSAGESLRVTEGFNSWWLTREGQNLASGNLFVGAEETATLTLPTIPTQKGRVEVVLKSDPEDVEIYIDGQLMTENGADLNYGDHTIRIESRDYSTWEQQITLNQPYMQVNAELSRLEIEVEIETSLTDVSIYCDGVLMGTTKDNQTVSFKALLGTYNLTLKKSGYEELQYALEIDDPEVPVLHLYFTQFTKKTWDPFSWFR